MDSHCFNCDSVSKYKCPTCRISYCSVACYQLHKQVPCTKPVALTNEIGSIEGKRTFYPTEDTLPLETLQKLKDSAELRKCLENPHVRHIMSMIDKSDNPTDLVAQAMIEPIFTEFATECLKVVQPDDRNEVHSSEEECI